MFDWILGKPWKKSFTMWGLAVLGAVRSAEGLGLVPAGSGDALGDVGSAVDVLVASLVGVANAIGAGMVIVGIRRAQGG